MHLGKSSVMHCLHRRFRFFFASYRLRQKPRHESQAASLIATCYARASTKAKIIRPDFGRSYRHLFFSNSQWKTGNFTLLYYIITSLLHPVSADYFRIRYRGKMAFLILVHVHDSSNNLVNKRWPPFPNVRMNLRMGVSILLYGCITWTLTKSMEKKVCEQFWTSPGGNTTQRSSYTATYLPSRKLSKLDEPDVQDTAGEAGTSS